MKKTFFITLILLISVNLYSQSTKAKINICTDKTIEDFNRTIKLCHEILEKDSMNLLTRYNLAMTYYKKADSLNFEKAIEQWDFIIKHDECYEHALYNRGLCKFFLGDNAGFCSDLRKAKNCEYPNMEEVYSYLKEYCANDFIILSGKVENTKLDSLVITKYKNYKKVIHVIHLEADKSFKDTLKVDDGYYTLWYSGANLPIYLKIGGKLNFNLNPKSAGDKIEYKGDKAKLNNYLYHKSLDFEKNTNLHYYGSDYDVNTFLRLTDSLYKSDIQFLKSVELDVEDENLQKLWIKLDYADKLASYQTYKQLKCKKPKLSENYPDFESMIDLNDENLLEIPNFEMAVSSIILSSPRQGANQQQAVINKIQNKKILNEVLFYQANSFMEYSSNIEEYYSNCEKYISTEAYITQLKEKYEKLTALKPGMPSPTFEFEDISGKTVKLEDLKGKLVYIDIWSTWCRPCLAEVPHLEELQEKLKKKDIYFVSICTSTTKEKWKKMVEEKDMKGIQLFGDRDSLFFSSYVLSMIPRFILLDSEGKIIDSDAIRPSNPGLKKQLKEFLK